MGSVIKLSTFLRDRGLPISAASVLAIFTMSKYVWIKKKANRFNSIGQFKLGWLIGII